MSKIIRAYTEEKPASFDLLKSINAGHELAEAPFMDKIKGAVKGAVDGFKGGNSQAQPAAQSAPADDTPDVDNGDDSADMSVLKSIVAQVVSSTALRHVLFLNFNDLRALYLKAGGGKAVIDSIKDDAALVTFAESKMGDGERFRLQAMRQGFTFADEIKSKQGFAVLMDIPKAIADEVATNKTNPTELRASLEKMMLHKYYVCTLNLSKAKKIGPAMTSAKGDIEAQALAFNPDVLENYPNRQKLNSAKEEWEDNYGGANKKDSDIDAKLADQERDARDPDKQAERDAQAAAADIDKPLAARIQTIFAGASNKPNPVKEITDSLFRLSTASTSGITYQEVLNNLQLLAKVWGKDSTAGKVEIEFGGHPHRWVVKPGKK